MLFNDVDAQLSASDPEEDSDSSEKHVVVSISSTTRGSGRVISLEDPATDQPAPVETGDSKPAGIGKGKSVTSVESISAT